MQEKTIKPYGFIINIIYNHFFRNFPQSSKMASVPKLFEQTQEESFFQFVQESGRCFYIPAYQRYFVWGEDDVGRLLTDFTAGMEAYASGTKMVTFLGTMTCFHDNKYESIEPMVRQDVPQGVLHVVDGQQRLTTLMMCSLIVHNKIRTLKAQCESQWLADRAEQCLIKLASTLELDKGIGEMRFYPKMIRAFDDRWSVNPSLALYVSPLARFIASYGAHYRQNSGSGFSIGKYQPLRQVENLSIELETAHKNFTKLVKQAQDAIDELCSNNDLFNAEKLLKQKDVVSLIFNLDEMPEEEIDYDDQHELLIALYFANYLLDCAHFVALVSPEEKQVYEIFEALNTTGQPLTAIQTFKPDVILFERLERYKNSISKKYIDKIEEHIITKSKPSDQQKLSAEIVTHFALAEKGERLGKHLSIQRQFLKKKFQQTNDNDKREFIRQLMCCSHVTQHLWDPNNDVLASFPGEVLLCLDFLNAANNKICIPVLARYYYEATKDNGEGQADFSELFAAIKACTAFFALWRSSRLTTEQIDDRYRSLFSDIAKANKVWARTILDDGPTTVPSVDFLKDTLRRMLLEGRVTIHDAASYKKAVYDVPLYRTSRNVAKFVLLVAMHNAVPSSADQSLYADGRDGSNPTLVAKAWKDKRFATVEHIVPQSEARDSLEKDLLHKLGNLTLLSSEANVLIKDRPWEERQIIYKILTEDSKEEARKYWDSLRSKPEGIEFEKLWSEKSTHTLATLGELANFGKRKIQIRSDGLCPRIWKILYEEWLCSE